MFDALWSLTVDGRLLFVTRFVRLFAYGALSVVLVLYLVSLGLTESATGALLTATLLGDTVVSLYLTTRADRFGRRRMLIVGALLMAAAGLAFAFTHQFWLLVVAGTIGVISPSGHEVGPFLPIEQAALSQVVPARARTDVFAWYTLAGSLATAFGALAAGLLTNTLQHRWAPVDSYRAVVVVYAGIGVALCALFLKASDAIEAPRSAQAAAPRSPLARLSGLHESQSVVLRLAALFALDSFGGGFVVQSFAAYWFYLRFGVDPKTLGALFFAANVFAGFSALVASRLANRIGLVNTMVVTHLPSNVLLMLIPLMPTLPLATLMLLLRFSISQMDVPTRQSYTMAVVAPEERAAASGITGVARTTGAALSPLFAGLLFARPSLINIPFYIAGILKIAYDLLLFRAFRALKPPEEVTRTGLVVLLVLAAAGPTALARNSPPSVQKTSFLLALKSSRSLTLNLGTRLGPYEIVAPLGIGGMGEVYRAIDTNLKRQVAIKVLPALVAADADRLARFQREAEILAALNHSNIAHIHGLEKADGTVALVMELVEGPTLADRIAQGPVSLDDALPIARQIAEALEAAHEQGIIHRDLKPANIKVRVDGTVKVLDFGLAKALTPEGASPVAEAALSPTITMPAMTMGGVILGTPAYMSPEQARGRDIDKRADIWAFGCVLFEMLTGAPAFGSENIPDVIANVLTNDPNWVALPASTPASVRRLLTRCLERDGKRRLHDIADARLDIDEVLDHPRAVPIDPTARKPSSSSKMTSTVVSLVAVVAALLGAAAAIVVMRSRDVVGRAAAEVVSFTVSLPPGAAISTIAPAAVLSPDGRHLVIVGREDASDVGSRALFLRTASDITPRKISGTDRAMRPFFSPDGRWIGFFRSEGNALMRIPLQGGGPVTIARVNGTGDATIQGADWGTDGTIVFGQRSGTSGFMGLSRVAASGGTPTELLPPDLARGEEYGWPQWLPGGEYVLFSIKRQGGTGAVAVLFDDDRSEARAG